MIFSATLFAQQSAEDACASVKLRSSLHKQIGSISGSSEPNVHFLQADWDIDPAKRYISGSQMFLLEPFTETSIVLDCAAELQVSEVQVNGSDAPFLQEGDLLHITLSAPVTELFVRYEGVPPQNGFGSFVQSTHGGTPVVWTLSEPFGARDWWPCFQNLSDKIDSCNLSVTVPNAYTGVTNGLLDRTTQPDIFHTTFHWQHRAPIAYYLIALAATNYHRFDQNIPLRLGTLPVHNYLYPEERSVSEDLLGSLAEIMVFFDSLFIPYPFMDEKYGHAQFGWGGGMEHQTISFMGHFSYDLIAHELAHQWFGNHVTCGSWEDVWLNEGFATYLNGLARERFQPETWRNWLEGRRDRIRRKPEGAVIVPANDLRIERIFDGDLSYSKGAMVLHQLRYEVGDSAFFAGLRLYLNRESPGFGHTEELRSALESTSGKDLGFFFNDFVYEPGYPVYTVIWNHFGANLQLQVNQEDPNGVPRRFRHSVPVLIKGDGEEQWLKLPLDGPENAFLLEPGFDVDTVVFDPLVQVLGELGRLYRSGQSSKDLIRIAPNPVDKELRLAFRFPQNEVQIAITDPAGRWIMQQSLPNGQSIYTIDVSGLAAGVYQLRVFRPGAEPESIPFARP